MCEICNKTPCDTRCPNAINEPVCYCAECGAELCAGENAYILDGEAYCEDCIHSNAISYIEFFADMEVKELEK